MLSLPSSFPTILSFSSILCCYLVYLSSALVLFWGQLIRRSQSRSLGGWQMVSHTLPASCGFSCFRTWLAVSRTCLFIADASLECGFRYHERKGGEDGYYPLGNFRGMEMSEGSSCAPISILIFTPSKDVQRVHWNGSIKSCGRVSLCSLGIQTGPYLCPHTNHGPGPPFPLPPFLQ